MGLNQKMSDDFREAFYLLNLSQDAKVEMLEDIRKVGVPEKHWVVKTQVNNHVFYKIANESRPANSKEVNLFDRCANGDAGACFTLAELYGEAMGRR